LRPYATASSSNAKRTEAALDGWRSAVRAEGTLVEKYLASCGIQAVTLLKDDL
jgi:hypothetical protein